MEQKYIYGAEVWMVYMDGAEVYGWSRSMCMGRSIWMEQKYAWSSSMHGTEVCMVWKYMNGAEVYGWSRSIWMEQKYG